MQIMQICISEKKEGVMLFQSEGGQTWLARYCAYKIPACFPGCVHELTTLPATELPAMLSSGSLLQGNGVSLDLVRSRTLRRVTTVFFFFFLVA